MPREAQNKVTDESMNAAFLDGVQEGMAAVRGEVEVFNVDIETNGVKIRTFQVREIGVVLDVLRDVLESYGPGTKFTVFVTALSSNALAGDDAVSPDQDDDVVDAEIVDTSAVGSEKTDSGG